MSKPTDDLDAVRQVAQLLEGFSEDERERIIRWTREKLGMQAPVAAVVPTAPASSSPTPSPSGGSAPSDIKSFLLQKNPKSERQLAAVVAYYYRFVAPEPQRKDSIGADELVEACRQGDRGRPKNPAQTLVNAFNDGYLDRGERGQYRINSVGENLVAMVLPGDSAPSRPLRKAVRKGKRPASRPARRRNPR